MSFGNSIWETMTRHEIITFSQRHIIYTMCMWINPGIHPLKYAFSCNLLILSTLVLSSFLLLPCHFSCIGTCILLFSPTFSSLLLPSPLFSCLLNTSLGTMTTSSLFLGTIIQHFLVFSMNLYWQEQICLVCWAYEYTSYTISSCLLITSLILYDSS